MESNWRHERHAKVSSFRSDAFTQSIMPLIYSSVYYSLIKISSLLNDTLLQVISVLNLATAVDALL